MFLYTYIAYGFSKKITLSQKFIFADAFYEENELVHFSLHLYSVRIFQKITLFKKYFAEQIKKTGYDIHQNQSVLAILFVVDEIISRRAIQNIHARNRPTDTLGV